MQFRGLPAGSISTFDRNLYKCFEKVDVEEIYENDSSFNLLVEFSRLRVGFGPGGRDRSIIREALSHLYEISQKNPDIFLDDIEAYVVHGVDVERGYGATESQHRAALLDKQTKYFSGAKTLLTAIRSGHEAAQQLFG